MIKKVKVVTTCIFMSIVFCAKAQYIDYSYMYQMQQMLNDLEMAKMMQQSFEQLGRKMDEIEKENKEMIERSMNVSAYFLPGSKTDSYKVLAVLSHSSIADKISIEVSYDAGDDIHITFDIKISECTVFGNQVYTPDFLKPGYRLVIKSKTKTFVSTEIPTKNSSQYEAFKKIANDNLQTLNANYSVPNDGTTVYPSSPQQNQYGRTRAQIIADIRKTERLKADAQQNQYRDNSISGRTGYNIIISQYNQRLIELRMELSKATR
jgi:hypothetical protein